MKRCATHCRALRDEMSRWLAQSLRHDGPGPHGGGEDEANYALAWFPHYLVTRDPRVVDRFRRLLDALRGWVERECVHGYEPEAEAHHGTEPFLLFLPRFLGLFPDDSVARSLLEDAAHHIGNWIDETPAWFDARRECFLSFHLGTRLVRNEAAYRFEVAEHLRFIHIAIAAHRVLGDGRYAEWALRYGATWARRILASGGDPMPLLWTQDGRGLRESDLATPEQRTMAATGHHVPGDPLAGIENLLASGAVNVFGDLFRLSGEPLFHDAARAIVAPLIPELPDPYGDPAAAAVGYYRWAFRDDSLDGAIRSQIARFPPEWGQALVMMFSQERKRREPGVGKRDDMIYWGLWADDGTARPYREPSTAALTLAYEITGDVDYATRAFRTAATKLAMARRVLRGGREHADMGGAICSVAAGHGRNWGQGAVTGCYGPLLLGARVAEGALDPLIEFRDAAAEAALPDGLLSLVRPPVVADGEVVFFNAQERPISFEWRPTGSDSGAPWFRVALNPGETRRETLRREGR